MHVYILYIMFLLLQAMSIPNGINYKKMNMLEKGNEKEEPEINKPMPLCLWRIMLLIGFVFS